MKTYHQMLGYLRGLRRGDRDWDEMDVYFPFYVNKGEVVTLSNGTKWRFLESRTFETIGALSAYVLNHQGMEGKKIMLLEDVDDANA